MIKPNDIEVIETTIGKEPVLIAKLRVAKTQHADNLRALYGDNHEAKIAFIKCQLWRSIYGEFEAIAAELRQHLRARDTTGLSAEVRLIDDLWALLEYPK